MTSYNQEMGAMLESKLQVLPYLAYSQMRIESSSLGLQQLLPGPGPGPGPLSKDMALALGLPSGNVDILRHRSVQRDAMPDWKLFQLFDVPPDPRNFKARLGYTRMDRRQSAHMNALHRLVYGKTAEECGRKVCKEYARAYAIEAFFPCAMRLDWAQFAVDKRGRKWQQHRAARQPEPAPLPVPPSSPQHAYAQQQPFGFGRHERAVRIDIPAPAGLVEGFVGSGNSELKEGGLAMVRIPRGVDSGCREWKLQNAKKLLGFQSNSDSDSDSNSNSPPGFVVTTAGVGVQFCDVTLKLG